MSEFVFLIFHYIQSRVKKLNDPEAEPRGILLIKETNSCLWLYLCLEQVTHRRLLIIFVL